MTTIVSSYVTQSQFINQPTLKTSFIDFTCLQQSTNLNFQITTKYHPHCPKRILVKDSIKMVNHACNTISIPFPLWEISFVRSCRYFCIFMSFWTQNDPFLRCEYLAIVQRGNSIFWQFFFIKQYLFINRLCSLCGR